MATNYGNLTSTYDLTEAGNPFTNDGSITEVEFGAALNATAVPDALITNNGSLQGGSIYGAGIALNAGVILNTGVVSGGTGYTASPKTFFGYINAGPGGDGVDASGFTSITNTSFAVIGGGTGGYTGYDVSGLAAGGGGTGLDLSVGGTVNNQGLIAGGTGGTATYHYRHDPTRNGAGGAAIAMSGTGTVTNSGEIIGGNATGTHAGGGDGIDLFAGGLITDAGQISGGQDLSGIGGTGVALLDGGTIVLESGGIISAGKSAAGNQSVGVILDGGVLKTAGLIAGGSAVSDSLQFQGAPSTVFVYHNASFQGAIGGFTYGDQIDLTNLAPTFVESHFNSTTDTINSLTDGTLHFAGDPTLIFTSDGNGGTLVTTACFRRGTQITTEHGERPIECLQIGDRVLTQDRELKPIRWIGRRHYAGATLIGRREVLPVQIRAGALGDQLPQRDLWVSPEHAMFLDGALVPAGLLTNEISILTDHSVSSVTYYHLEFDAQEVIFAEGAPAESFVDDDSRRMFDNAADYARRYPDAAHKSPTFCAPRLEEGAPLEILRARLAAVAGTTAMPPEPLHLEPELHA